MSARADEYATDKMRNQVPDLAQWPLNLALETRPAADFTIVLSPNVALVSQKFPEHVRNLPNP